MVKQTAMMYVRIRYLHKTVTNIAMPLEFYNSLLKVIEEKEDTIVIEYGKKPYEFRRKSIERWI